jgi:hypothetical protein
LLSYRDSKDLSQKAPDNRKAVAAVVNSVPVDKSIVDIKKLGKFDQLDIKKRNSRR